MKELKENKDITIKKQIKCNWQRLMIKLKKYKDFYDWKNKSKKINLFTMKNEYLQNMIIGFPISNIMIIYNYHNSIILSKWNKR